MFVEIGKIDFFLYELKVTSYGSNDFTTKNDRFTSVIITLKN